MSDHNPLTLKLVQSSDVGQAGRCRQGSVEEHAFSFTCICQEIMINMTEQIILNGTVSKLILCYIISD